jgi:hypothetical protein
MTKEANGREVFFFGKKRKLNDDSAFKVGRMTVRVRTEIAPEGRRWYATLSAYDGHFKVEGPLGRSKAAAVKKLERRIDSLHRAFNALYESYV